MNVLEEIKETVKLEIRPSSIEGEYLEAVVEQKDLDGLLSILKKHLGTAAKEPGKVVTLPPPLTKIVEELGGLRTEQTFFYRQESQQITYAALWPWESNPKKITLKSGIKKS